MANHKIEEQDPGLGMQYGKSVTRMMNPDGSYNIIRIGAVNKFRDVYKFLIDLPLFYFALLLIGGFVVVNCFFAIIYVFIGVEHIHGVSSELNPFAAAWYFSAQTFTTVGYGELSPKGNLTSVIAAFEAFFGLIAFAMATGLIYGRFSKPSARIAFSKNIIITPYKNGYAVMFKIVNQRNNVLLNAKINALVSQLNANNDKSYSRHYYTMKLEVDFVRYFPLTWTLVHPIDEESPFYKKSLEQILGMETEVLLLIEAFDETFSQNVLQKHSYAHHQWKSNVKFKRSFAENEDGKIVLNIRELDELENITE